MPMLYKRWNAYKKKHSTAMQLLRWDKELSEISRLLTQLVGNSRFLSMRLRHKFHVRWDQLLSKFSLEYQIIRLETRLLTVKNTTIYMDVRRLMAKYREVAAQIPEDHPMTARIESFLKPKAALSITIPEACGAWRYFRHHAAKEQDTWMLSLGVLVAQLEHQHATGCRTVLHPAFDIFLSWRMNAEVEGLGKEYEYQKPTCREAFTSLMYYQDQSQSSQSLSFKISYVGNESPAFSELSSREWTDVGCNSLWCCQ